MNRLRPCGGPTYVGRRHDDTSSPRPPRTQKTKQNVPPDPVVAAARGSRRASPERIARTTGRRTRKQSPTITVPSHRYADAMLFRSERESDTSRSRARVRPTRRSSTTRGVAARRRRERRVFPAGRRGDDLNRRSFNPTIDVRDVVLDLFFFPFCSNVGINVFSSFDSASTM